MWEEATSFPCGCKADSGTRDAHHSWERSTEAKLIHIYREELQNMCHSRLLIMDVTRCWRTHAEKAELEPYRKGYQDLVNWSLSWVCPCLVWLMQGVAVAEMPTGEVARGRSWGFQWDDGGDVNPLLASECDCFTGCDTTKEQLTKDRQRQLPPWYPRDILDPNPSDILSPTLVPKCFFVIALWETKCWYWTSSSSVLESLDHRLHNHHVSILSCISCMSLVA